MSCGAACDHPSGWLPAFRERAPWLGGDLQTLRNRLLWPAGALVPAQRLILPLRNGAGALSAALTHPPTGPDREPVVLLVHGLGGCEDSAYMLIAARALLDAGYSVIRLNLRGAGPSARFSKAPYHAGLAGDLRDALAELDRLLPGRPVVAMGFSLGGHMLLKLACEDGSKLSLAGLVTVSAPLDLAEAQSAIARARNRIYERYIVATMARDIGAISHFPRRLYEVDAQIVAPAHGFAGADDYYRKASVLPHMPELARPALILHADNDPWIPCGAYRRAQWSRKAPVAVVLTRGGGHVGFHAAGLSHPWYVPACLAFISQLDISERSVSES